MMNYEKDVFLGFHIPKTGGVAIINHLKHHLGENRILEFPSPEDLLHNNVKNKLSSIRGIDDVKVCFGHFVSALTGLLFEGRVCRYFTVLRDPAEHIVSWYNYNATFEYTKNGRPAPSFLDWHRTLPPNPQCLFIEMFFFDFCHEEKKGAFEKAMEALSFFEWVLPLEGIDVAGASMLSTLGVPTKVSPANVSGVDHPVYQRLDDRLREYLYCEHQADLELYRVWRNAKGERPVPLRRPPAVVGSGFEAWKKDAKHRRALWIENFSQTRVFR